MTRLHLMGDVAFTEASRGDWIAPDVAAWLCTGLGIANLECVLGGPEAPPERLVVRGPTEAAGWLRAAGVGLVTLANNHITDLGADGLSATCAALDAAGVAHVGCGLSESEARAPRLVVHDGLTLGVIGRLDPRSFSQPERCIARGPRAGAAALDVDEAVATAHRLRAQGADLTICLLHWGIQGIPLLPSWLAEPMARLGAAFDIVAGTHAHILQPARADAASVRICGMGNLHFAPLRHAGRVHYAEPGIDRLAAVFTVTREPAAGTLSLEVRPTTQAMTHNRVQFLGPAAASLVRAAVLGAPERAPLLFDAAWRAKELTSLGRYAWRERRSLARRHLDAELPGKLWRSLRTPKSR
ncbi:MAG: CapA family protein [Deltaproteobacteria bacterium]|nr:CapA family protein [Deltaproteobacteria bacterium]MCB9785476.1 CapA family protein [Deltaproteobacteria bacterium]